MSYKPYLQEALFETDRALELIANQEKTIIGRAEKSVSHLQTVIDQLQDFVLSSTFESDVEEIEFFKFDKPLLASKLVYFMKVYRIERRRPIGSQSLQLSHLNSELADLDHIYRNYRTFYDYYRSGATLLDTNYFLRGRQDVHLLIDTEWAYASPRFSTGYDHLVSLMLANEQLIPYLNGAIAELTSKPVHFDAASQHDDTGKNADLRNGFVQTPFRGAEVYVFLKSLIDSQAIINHTYKSFFELTAPGIANMQKKSFIPEIGLNNFHCMISGE